MPPPRAIEHCVAPVMALTANRVPAWVSMYTVPLYTAGEPWIGLVPRLADHTGAPLAAL